MASLSLVTQPKSQISAPQAQLPVAWYVDPDIYAIEQKYLFAKAPKYLGHELMVPNVGDYQVLDWTGEAKSLIRQQESISVISNVCRHRQAIMLKGHGHTKISFVLYTAGHTT